jgi:hypothetical protein
MQSKRQKALNSLIEIDHFGIMELKLIEKLAKKIMKQSEFNNYTIRSRANKLF